MSRLQQMNSLRVKILKDADLRTAEEKGQYSLLDECDGMCGV